MWFYRNDVRRLWAWIVATTLRVLLVVTAAAVLLMLVTRAAPALRSDFAAGSTFLGSGASSQSQCLFNFLLLLPLTRPSPAAAAWWSAGSLVLWELCCWRMTWWRRNNYVWLELCVLCSCRDDVLLTSLSLTTYFFRDNLSVIKLCEGKRRRTLGWILSPDHRGDKHMH